MAPDYSSGAQHCYHSRHSYGEAENLKYSTDLGSVGMLSHTHGLTHTRLSHSVRAVLMKSELAAEDTIPADEVGLRQALIHVPVGFPL